MEGDKISHAGNLAPFSNEHAKRDMLKILKRGGGMGIMAEADVSLYLLIHLYSYSIFYSQNCTPGALQNPRPDRKKATGKTPH